MTSLGHYYDIIVTSLSHHYDIIFHIFQSCSSLDDEIPESMAIDGTFQEFHPPDLSTWRVSIPRTGAISDLDNLKKQYFVFTIDIRRVDDVSKGKLYRDFPLQK